MIDNEEIEEAKNKIVYISESYHEHNDCIRIAYEWLDAQIKTKNITNGIYPIKHLIERWAGRYVSTADVEVAAFMHPDIKGKYPRFNVKYKLTEPSTQRLDGIPEAFKHQQYRESHDPSRYSETE